MSIHIGRRFSGHDMEDECPCPQEPCGLVDLNKAVPECEQHQFHQTIRQSHPSWNCPGG